MENSIEDESETEVLIERQNNRDKFNIVYMIVFFTGIGTLIPWNFFITANSYFEYQLSSNVSNNETSTDSDNNLKHFFENYLALFSMIPLALTNISNLLLRRFIPPMTRFNTGIIIMFAVFLLTLVFTRIDVSEYRSVFFAITMVSVSILNICSGLIQGSSFGIISMMPDRYIKALMEGQAISGLLAAITQILSISVIKSHVTWSAFIYFLIALIFLIFTGVGFSRLGTLKFSRAYVEYSSILDNEQVITDSTETLNTINNANSSLVSSTTSHKLSLKDKYLPLIKVTCWHIMSAYLTFTVTLSLFPAIISQIKSLSGGSKEWKEQYFSPVTCFLFFNCADYLGRFLTGVVKFPSDNHPKCIFLITVLRIVFIPLFMLCNVANKKHMPTVFKSDAFPIIFNWLLGVSNGYFGTLALIYAPNQVSDGNKEAVGTIMSLFLCLGLTSGVALSFIFVLIV